MSTIPNLDNRRFKGMRLGEKVCNLIFGGDWRDLQELGLRFFSHNATINFKVLGTFVKHMVDNNVKSF